MVQRSWQQFEHSVSRDQVLVIKSAPHGWLFPGMVAVVHHGGAGTTAAGLRAGVPNILRPQFADQFFWIDWVVRRGGGPCRHSRGSIERGKVDQYINIALNDNQVRANAAVLGAIIRHDRGIRRAIELIESIPKEDPGPVQMLKA